MAGRDRTIANGIIFLKKYEFSLRSFIFIGLYFYLVYFIVSYIIIYCIEVILSHESWADPSLLTNNHRWQCFSLRGNLFPHSARSLKRSWKCLYKNSVASLEWIHSRQLVLILKNFWGHVIWAVLCGFVFCVIGSIRNGPFL